MRTDQARRERFARIADEVFEPVQRYFIRRAAPDMAADAFSDTMLTVWRRIDDIPDDATLPWCYGVARRTLANHRRGAARQLRLVERVKAVDLAGTGSISGDPQLEIERLDPELDRALETLSESETEIVHLWAWERLEPREIAAVLDTTPNAVSVALNRSKRKLRSELDRQERPPAGHEDIDGIIGEEGQR